MVGSENAIFVIPIFINSFGKGIVMHPLFNTINPYLEKVTLMVIATCQDNQPWLATVFYCYDNDLHLYFLSRLHRRHSQEILRNQKIAVAIADKHFNLGDKVKGIQIEGTCRALSEEDAKRAFTWYKKRFPQAEKIMEEDALTRKETSFAGNDVIHRIWKVTPVTIKVFDEEMHGSSGKEYRC